MIVGPALVAVVAFASLGIGPVAAQEVIVYTALDSEFSRPILERFAEETGVDTRPKFDVESTKTVGLTQAIIAEARRPRCDVFWNNEILNTLRLDERGLLEVYRPAQADDYPAMFRSPKGTWHGFAARARVLIVNTKLVKDNGPASVHDLADPKWKGRAGIAKPLFGTTATHVACLFAKLGPDNARELLTRMKDNDVHIMSGNKQVARAVASGQLAFGLTDTDDAMIEVEAGHPVTIVCPDQGDDESALGTLFIPNTLAIIKGSPHQEEARRLVDYLLRPEVEIELSKGPSAQIPLNKNVKDSARVETPATVRAMKVDFYEAAHQWDDAARFVRDHFAAAE